LRARRFRGETPNPRTKKKNGKRGRDKQGEQTKSRAGVGEKIPFRKPPQKRCRKGTLKAKSRRLHEQLGGKVRAVFLSEKHQRKRHSCDAQEKPQQKAARVVKENEGKAW